ncbi:MAG: ATP synthase F1 subunit delta [Gaiella sp.]
MAVADRLYARSLFEAARDHGRVAEVRQQLAELAAAVGGSPELEGFLANPQVDTAAKSAVLGELTDGADQLVSNFARLVASKGRAAQLRAMAVEFDSIADAAEGRIAVELTTAHELTDDEAADIVRKIEQTSGRSVDASRSVDPGLLGGVILQAGSMRVDASVRGRLDRLRRDLLVRG